MLLFLLEVGRLGLCCIFELEMSVLLLVSDCCGLDGRHGGDSMIETRPQVRSLYALHTWSKGKSHFEIRRIGGETFDDFDAGGSNYCGVDGAFTRPC